MDIYTPTSEKLLEHYISRRWPELGQQVQQATLRQPGDWRLPLLACQAVGGNFQQALPAIMAIACLQISIILVDDLLDEDPRGDYRIIGPGAAANLGLALQALALDVIAIADVPEPTRGPVIASLNRMALLTACGQYTDMLDVTDEAGYWALIRAKSSPFFGTAMFVGALLGGASLQVADGLQQLGCLHGEMVQIYDDLKDALAVPANPDWFHGRKSLPLLYAETVPHWEQAYFTEVRQSIPEPGALKEAQQILARSGAISFCIAALVERHRRAGQLLEMIDLAYRDDLVVWLQSQLDPVRELFQSLGLVYPEAA